MGKMLLALALALVLVELLFHLSTAAIPANMKDLQITTNLPCLMVTPEMFSWWKPKMYSHIIGMDEELWDILEDGVGNFRLDEEGVALDRKAHTTEQKKLYK